MESKPQQSFLLADGDCVGDRLELLLLDGRVEEAATFSRQLARAVELAAEKVAVCDGWSLVFAGGDELLAVSEPGVAPNGLVAAIAEAFESAAGVTVSVGIGPTPSAAVGNLRRAKLGGKNRVVGEDG